MQRNVVIAGYARSPFHFAHKGELAKVRPDELAAQVVEALIARTGVDPAEDIEDLIVGCAFPEGEQGMNVARLIALLADLPIVGRRRPRSTASAARRCRRSTWRPARSSWMPARCSSAPASNR